MRFVSWMLSSLGLAKWPRISGGNAGLIPGDERSKVRLHMDRETPPNQQVKPVHPMVPEKSEVALLPCFSGLALERIHVPKTKQECEAAAREILAAGVAGFDTEAKPIFKVGEKSDGPHVVQFALTDRAFIFQTNRAACRNVAAELIASERLLKVGFGLKNDHGQIRNRLGVKLSSVRDLDHAFRKKGYRGQVGVRGAVAVLLKQCFLKSKSTTTSNWAAEELSTRQLVYAANDAFAALKIHEALERAD